jgi:hypothetical protein
MWLTEKELKPQVRRVMNDDASEECKENRSMWSDFYALRQIIGYIGSGNWGSAQNFVEKHGWNLYNSKGAFIMEVKQELLGSLLSSELLPK